MAENQPSGQTAGASGDAGSKDQVSYDTFSKLLNEKKKLQQEMLETKSRLEQYEQEKLEHEGKLKEALENAKKAAQTEREKGLKIFKTASEKAIKSQFRSIAESLGCVDAEAAMKLTDFSDLDLTEEFEFDQSKLKTKIEHLAKDKAYLFKKDFKLPQDVTPSNSQIPSKPLHELSEQEIKQLLKQAK
ncbi:MAG TPA: hypothetical protein V6C58_24775 [Allocoleopsis sp.]